MANISAREVKIFVIDSVTPVGQENDKEDDQIVRETRINDAVIVTRKLGDFIAEGLQTAVSLTQYKIFCNRIGSWKKIIELESSLRDKLGRLEYDLWKKNSFQVGLKYFCEFAVESIDPVNPSMADDDNLHPIAYTYRIFVTSWGKLTVDDIQAALVSVFRF